MKSITPELIEELKKVGWFNECFHAQLDHIFPKSKGGSDEPFNFAAACVTCNALKLDYAPAGETRAERIADAAQYIREQRRAEEEKWSRYREIVRDS